MIPLVGFVGGAAVGIGVLLAVMGAVGVESRPARQPRSLPDLSGLTVRVVAGLALGAVLWALTGWVAGMVIAGAVAALTPTLWGAKSRRDAVIARTEAVAAWAEMLHDTMAAGAGLSGAIGRSAGVAPEPIRPYVSRLANRLERPGEDTRAAFLAFADDVDDPAADVVVMALLTASGKVIDRGGPARSIPAKRIPEVLQKASTVARASASMRSQVEASRARTYTSTRIIMAVTVGLVAFIMVFNRSYLEPFESPFGQLMLIVVAGLLTFGLWWLSRMAKISSGVRILASGGAS